MVKFNEIIERIKNNKMSNSQLVTVMYYFDFNPQNDEKEAKEFFEALSANKSITELILENKKLGVLGGKYLSEYLIHNQTLKSLHIIDIKLLGPKFVKEIAHALKHNLHLTRIRLGSFLYSFGDEGAITIAEALKSNSTLTRIQLDYNMIGPEGARALALAIKENQGLRYVDLSFNHIGALGAQFLAEALKTNQTVVELDVFKNGLGDLGTQSLVHALTENQNLRLLQLGHNKIQEHGFRAIGIALRTNRSLQALNLNFNDFPSARSVQEITDGLKQNNSLTRLTLGKCLDSEDVKAFSEVLTSNQSLTSLEFEVVSTMGANHLTDALKENRSLTHLGLRDIEVLDEGGFELGGRGPGVNAFSVIQQCVAKNIALKNEYRVSLLMAFHARSGKSLFASLPKPKDNPASRDFFGTLFAFLGCNKIPYVRKPFEKLAHVKAQVKGLEQAPEKGKEKPQEMGLEMVQVEAPSIPKKKNDVRI